MPPPPFDREITTLFCFKDNPENFGFIFRRPIIGTRVGDYLLGTKLVLRRKKRYVLVAGVTAIKVDRLGKNTSGANFNVNFYKSL